MQRAELRTRSYVLYARDTDNVSPCKSVVKPDASMRNIDNASYIAPKQTRCAAEKIQRVKVEEDDFSYRRHRVRERGRYRRCPRIVVTLIPSRAPDPSTFSRVISLSSSLFFFLPSLSVTLSVPISFPSEQKSNIQGGQHISVFKRRRYLFYKIRIRIFFSTRNVEFLVQ